MIKKFLALFISLVTVFAMTTAVVADPASVVVGGDFQLEYTSEDGELTADPGEEMLWWEFQATSYKNFGDNGQAYLKIKATKDDSLFLSGFGYTYKVNDKLSFTWRDDSDGEFLTDGLVISNGCDWHDPSTGTLDVNFFDRVFRGRSMMKMDATPLRGLNLTLAYAPESTPRIGSYSEMPEQILIKGKYTTDLYKIGFGYTNTREGYTEGANQFRALYSVNAEIYPTANLKIYGEYIDWDCYLVKGTWEFAPFTLKATYGNIGYEKTGKPTYLANTVDCELDYALSANKTIIAGLAHYISTDYDGLANVTAGISVGPLTALVQHDFDQANDNAEPFTKLIGKYNLDGTNTLEADLNIEQEIYNLKLYVYFW